MESPTQIKIIKYNRSVIMKNAYEIKRNQNISFGEAQKQAWQEAKAMTLIHVLALGSVEFSYVTTEGVIRMAKGTTNLDLYTGSKIENSEDVAVGKNIAYFDFDKEARRQCKIGRLLKISRVCIYKKASEYQMFMPKYFSKVA